MHWEGDRSKIFTRRAAVLGAGQAVLVTALVGRMYYLQVIDSARYKTLSEENRINLRLLAPPRGRILDRNGITLADNKQNYRVVVIREQAGRKGIQTVLDMLGTFLPISEAERRKIFKEISRKRSFVPVTVKENLSWEQVAQIEVNTHNLPGIMIEEGESRHYRCGTDCSHVLGYVAPPSEKELTGDPLLQLPDFRIGKAGVEKTHDLAMRGTGGNSQVEVNALGRIIREVGRNEGEPGADIQLTLDSRLQSFAANRLGANSAAAVVIDVHAGDILSMVSTPAYDPAAFNEGLSARMWKSLISDPRAPLRNKAISGQYPPGSTFKGVVALAALEYGIVAPEKSFFCNGYVELGNARFHCWKRHGHGHMNMSEAIKQSCDVYFYETAKRLGIERIATVARKMGLGDELGIELPGEMTGLVPDKNWKLGARGVPWQGGETLIAGIGQGYLLTTPLQLAVMTARLVNGGQAVTPRLTRRIGAPPEKAPAPKGLGLSLRNLDFVAHAMGRVVNELRGTAHRSRIKTAGMEMGGKTGTAQVRRITKAEREAGVRKNEDLPWKFRDHALFIGFAPVESPRYAVAVVVEHGGSGSKAAAPVARDILHQAQILNAGGLESAAAPPPEDPA